MQTHVFIGQIAPIESTEVCIDVTDIQCQPIRQRKSDSRPRLPRKSRPSAARDFQSTDDRTLNFVFGNADARHDIRRYAAHGKNIPRRVDENGFVSQSAANTAEAAKTVAEKGDKSVAALASAAAAELYGLKILRSDMQDFDLNMTRFWILERAPRKPDTKHPITSLIFKVKNIPAVLYKCLGGFATNGVNLLRIESFVDADRFFANAAFLVDVAADSDDAAFQSALDELAFFAQDIKILGTYAADAARLNGREKQ